MPFLAIPCLNTVRYITQKHNFRVKFTEDEINVIFISFDKNQARIIWAARTNAVKIRTKGDKFMKSCVTSPTGKITKRTQKTENDCKRNDNIHSYGS
jgi:hypothetical protein